MSQLKRILAIMMAGIMLIGITACGEPSDEASSTVGETYETKDALTENTKEEAAVTEEEVDQYIILTDEDGNPYDLGGMEIIIADWWSSGEEEEAVSAYDEAHQEYLDWIQKTYHFTIKQQAITSWGDVPEDFVNYATTGGEENYIFTLYQGSALTSALMSGLMYDLSTLDCLDFSEDKWETVVTNLMTIGDATYGMRGILHEATAGIYFNKRLLEESGIDPDSIYELQANNEWTWDKFEELCQQVQKDTDNDGVIDQNAMTNFTSTLYPAAVFSNGGEFIGKDENGYYNALESDATLEALNWALDMIDKYEMIYPEDAEWDYTYTAFANGEAVFTCAESYKAGEWSDMEDDFGFVCFPMGPLMDHYVNYAHDNVYVIPSCYDEDKAWKLAFVYNLYTDPVPGYEDSETWKSGYYQSFRDTESVDETLAIMVNSGVPMNEKAINGIDMGSDLFWSISKDNTPAQKAESIRNTWQSYIDQTNSQ
ncbi:carbohydrate ABC transporter substrate-binding protein (CUT1 family) [Lachnotalea glycerini]|uniref:Carbohydrate ABC transporter substrate-binding protein (CUT1 family) n=1 Tax=Lachnotalea glycerini TaxID=1763509 RepID=A0A318ETL1_9FIRM|nr:ABC transporter substrate-binding protein [Lachnotalea glycerini]PXV95850.1 carbohydrate ABC transporter substrate-binding protein (CUT1 family) [Lachnotalea glycerini]